MQLMLYLNPTIIVVAASQTAMPVWLLAHWLLMGKETYQRERSMLRMQREHILQLPYHRWHPRGYPRGVYTAYHGGRQQQGVQQRP